MTSQENNAVVRGKGGGGLHEDDSTTPGKIMNKYEITSNITENRQYWNIMVKTGDMVSKER